MNKFHRILFAALAAVLLASCAVDPLRYKAEVDSHALAVQCADGWFTGQPVPSAEDQRLVRKAFADWAARLEAEAKLLPGGGK